MTADRLNAQTTRTEIDLVALGARVTFLGHVVGRGLGFLLIFLLTRWLGASDYGVFILVVAIFHFAGMFSDKGLRYGALRFVAMAEGRRDVQESRRVIGTVVRYSLTASLVGMVILAASSPVLVNWFRVYVLLGTAATLSRYPVLHLNHLFQHFTNEFASYGEKKMAQARVPFHRRWYYRPYHNVTDVQGQDPILIGATATGFAGLFLALSASIQVLNLIALACVYLCRAHILGKATS